MNTSDQFFLLLQRFLPKKMLTAAAGRMAEQRNEKKTLARIQRFIKRYDVDMEEAAEPDPADYLSFNEFFTRALRPGARPIAAAEWVSPVDARISQMGPIRGSRLIQAKNQTFTLKDLLGGEKALAHQFTDAHFATLYLAPGDYHRIHMPRSGRLLRMLYVPGEFWSVNQVTARKIPDLYARNERVICVFEADGDNQPFIMVMVGALLVGSIEMVWHGAVNAGHDPEPRRWDYSDQKIRFRKGDEIGRFLMGSTVIMLFPPGGLHFSARCRPGKRIRMGEYMARPDPTASGKNAAAEHPPEKDSAS